MDAAMPSVGFRAGGDVYLAPVPIDADGAAHTGAAFASMVACLVRAGDASLVNTATRGAGNSSGLRTADASGVSPAASGAGSASLILSAACSSDSPAPGGVLQEEGDILAAVAPAATAEGVSCLIRSVVAVGVSGAATGLQNAARRIPATGSASVAHAEALGILGDDAPATYLYRVTNVAHVPGAGKKVLTLEAIGASLGSNSMAVVPYASVGAFDDGVQRYVVVGIETISGSGKKVLRLEAARMPTARA
jgi:hypothetical protein